MAMGERARLPPAGASAVVGTGSGSALAAGGGLTSALAAAGGADTGGASASGALATAGVTGSSGAGGGALEHAQAPTCSEPAITQAADARGIFLKPSLPP